MSEEDPLVVVCMCVRIKLVCWWMAGGYCGGERRGWSRGNKVEEGGNVVVGVGLGAVEVGGGCLEGKIQWIRWGAHGEG